MFKSQKTYCLQAELMKAWITSRMFSATLYKFQLLLSYERSAFRRSSFAKQKPSEVNLPDVWNLISVARFTSPTAKTNWMCFLSTAAGPQGILQSCLSASLGNDQVSYSGLQKVFSVLRSRTDTETLLQEITYFLLKDQYFLLLFCEQSCSLILCCSDQD